MGAEHFEIGETLGGVDLIGQVVGLLTGAALEHLVAGRDGLAERTMQHVAALL